MNPHVYLLPFLAVISLSGCATPTKQPSLDDIGSYLSLHRGVSTKQDVHSKFGQPGDVVYQKSPPAPSAWTYYRVKVRGSGWTLVPFVGVLAAGVHEDSTTATFEFDPANRYTDVHTAKDSKYVNSWVGITRETYRMNTDTKAGRVEQEMKSLGLPFDKKYADEISGRR